MPLSPEHVSILEDLQRRAATEGREHLVATVEYTFGALGVTPEMADRLIPRETSGIDGDDDGEEDEDEDEDGWEDELDEDDDDGLDDDDELDDLDDDDAEWDEEDEDDWEDDGDLTEDAIDPDDEERDDCANPIRGEGGRFNGCEPGEGSGSGGSDGKRGGGADPNGIHERGHTRGSPSRAKATAVKERVKARTAKTRERVKAAKAKAREKIKTAKAKAKAKIVAAKEKAKARTAKIKEQTAIKKEYEKRKKAGAPQEQEMFEQAKRSFGITRKEFNRQLKQQTMEAARMHVVRESGRRQVAQRLAKEEKESGANRGKDIDGIIQKAKRDLSREPATKRKSIDDLISEMKPSQPAEPAAKAPPPKNIDDLISEAKGSPPAPAKKSIDDVIQEAKASASPAKAAPASRTRAPASPATPRIAADLAEKAAKSVPESGRFGAGKVFISEAYKKAKEEEPSLTMETFKEGLLQARREGKIQLARADLPRAMPKEMVENSQLSDGIGDFHFIKVKE